MSASTHQPARSAFLLKIALLVWVLIAAGGGYIFWQKQELSQIIDAKKTEQQALSQALQSQEKRAGKIHQSKQIMSQAETYRRPWSEVAQATIQLENRNIRFDASTATREGRLTLQGSSRSVAAISGLLENLTQSPQWEDPFVSSIGFPATAEEPYTFQLEVSLISETF